jgi:glycosyltransferase 2 family protein
MSYDPGAGRRRDSVAHRRLIRDLLGLVVSIVALGAFVWWALHQKRPHFPSSAEDLLLIGVAVALYGLATVVRGWRWHRILKRADVDHRRADAFALTAVGYMGNTILPARGGELLRVLLLGERSTARRREILGAIVAERVLDALALVVLFGVLTWSGVAGTHEGKLPAAIGAGIVLAGAVGLAFYIRLRSRGMLERFAAIIRPFVRASRLLFDRLGAALFLVTCGIWVLEGVIFWTVGKSLHLRFGVLEGTFLTVLTSFFLLIPAAPGYIGTFDGALVVGLRAIGVLSGQRLAFVLLARFVLFVPVTVAGLVLMVARYGGLRLLPTGPRRKRYAA